MLDTKILLSEQFATKKKQKQFTLSNAFFQKNYQDIGLFSKYGTTRTN